jgi:hypothetical protein
MQAAKAKIEEIKRQKEIEKVPKNSSNRLKEPHLVILRSLLAKERARRRAAVQRKIAVANPKRQRRARTKGQSERSR